MSSELDSQIREELLKEKFFKFLNKFKKYIIIFFILIIALPSFYQAHLAYDKKKNETLFEKYSDSILLIADKNEKEAIKILNDIINDGKNETITLLSFHELFKLYNKQKQVEKIIFTIDKILKDKKLSNNNKDLLKVKKSLIIFDKASESEMLSLLNIQNQKNILRKISLKIMSDFYISKKNYQKSKNILNDVK